ncbi:MAG: porin [Pseudomonadota bacterium]
MKKILFATTAVVASAAAGVALASEKPTGFVGGYMFMGAGLSDANTADNTEVGILRDGEIFLGWRGSSDNGLTFDGRIELEAFTAVDQIDENWGRVSGSFGAVLIGSNDTAGDNVGDVGIICGPGCRLAYYDGFGVTPEGGSNDGIDALGIHYTTPNISGFTAGVSYHPSGRTDGLPQQPVLDQQNNILVDAVAGDTGYGFASRGENSRPKNVYSLAANYAGDFDSFSFAIGGDYTSADQQSLLELWSIGAEVGFSGFTLGVHYENNEAADDQDIAVGVQYKTGPWTIAGGYAHTDVDNGSNIDSFAGWVTYALAPGVTAAAGLEYGDQDESNYNALTYLAISF